MARRADNLLQTRAQAYQESLQMDRIREESKRQVRKIPCRQICLLLVSSCCSWHQVFCD